MGDDQAQDTSAAADPPAETGGLDERVTRVENALERIEQAIGRLVPGSHAEAQRREETRLDRPTAVAEQVRAELAKARKEEEDATAAAAATTAQADERQQVQDRLARLEERPPAPPRSRRTVMLGWGDGRG